MDKQLALESLQFRLRRTANWRHQQADRFPDDPRNDRASKKLDALSRADIATVTTEQWLALEPLLKRNNANDLIDDAARAVEFRAKAETLGDVVSLIITKFEQRRRDYEVRHAS